MTRAARLEMLAMFAKARDQQLRDLGPRPPWWRPFRRRAWHQRHDAIVALRVQELDAMFEEHYDADRIMALVNEESPLFRMMRSER